jgi:hypothetical protein
MNATVSREKRQITLPADVVKAADLRVGDLVEWRFEEGEIRGRKLAPKLTETPVVKPVRTKEGFLMWPVRVDRKRIVAVIRADRDAR